MIYTVNTFDSLFFTITVLDRLTFSEAKSAGPFLDGCNVRKLNTR